PGRVAAERFALFGLHDRRGLQQPRRRARGQRVNEAFVIRCPEQLVDRLEHRIVRFLPAESLDALAARDLYILQQTGALDELVDERRLAHACLPGHEDDLALAPLRALEILVETRAGRESIDEWLRRRRKRDAWRAAIVGHRSDELIAAFRKGTNELQVVPAVAEHLPDSQDVLLDDLLVHEGVGPQGFENLFLRHEPVAVVDEIPQEIEGLWRERDALLPLPQAVVRRVEPERVELLHRVIVAFASVDFLWWAARLGG